MIAAVVAAAPRPDEQHAEGALVVGHEPEVGAEAVLHLLARPARGRGAALPIA